MTKLLNKKTKEEVDIAPDAVAAAIDSGQFGFSSKRGVPVNFDGQFGYVKPEYASKHRDRLMFINEGDVEQRQAEERFKGIGGAAQALGYGAAKGLTLGVLPALGAAISPEFAEYSKQIELGRPGLTAAGELGSLAVDPFAAAGKVLGLGAKGAKAAQEAGVAARATRAAETAAPRVMEGVYEAERAVPALAGAPAEAAPLRLGGRVAGAEPQAGAGFAAREAQAAAREPRALPPAGREPIAAPESPLTYQAPPFESQVMTDLRLGRADTAERLGELDRTIQSTLGSKAKGAKQAVKGLREERDALAQQLDEYDFQLLKFEQPEAQALGAQAERAVEAGKYRVPAAKPTPAKDVAGMTQEQLADYYAANGLPEGVDAYTALTARPSMRGLSRAEMIERFNASGGADAGRKWADQMESTWLKIAEEKPAGIKAAGGDSMWTNFRVGKDVSPAAGAARDKAYVTLSDPLSLSGKDLTGFLEALRKAKYNGQVKVPGSGARLITNFDNIVMHGATKADAELGEELARKFFGERVEATSFGRDVDGKSHTQLLAESLEKNAPIMLAGKVSAAAPEMKLGERAAAEAEQARQRLRMGGGAPEYVGPEPGPLALGGERGLAKAETPSVLDAEFMELPAAGPRLTPEAPTPMPAAAPPVAPGRGFKLPEGMASMAAQGGVYGASEEARRQATGESEGGLGAVLGAGAVGAAVPAALMLGGKSLAKGAEAAGAFGLGETPGTKAQRFAKVAGGVEDAHILRMFGISNKQVDRLNAQFTEAGVGRKGTSNFADFIKREVGTIEELKSYLPDNEILQGIPTDKPLKFGQLTPERRTAIAEAVKAKLGKQYDELLPPELTSLAISNDELRTILSGIQATAVKGLGATQFKTIAPELNAFRKAINSGQEMTVGELRQMRKTLDDIFSARNGGFDKKFTPQQTTFRNAIDDVIFSTLDDAAPGTSNAIRALNKEYTMAGILERGAQAAETKAATTSPIGRDLLSQAALGVAIGNPIGAAGFLVGSTVMRGIYNARGDGIIADLAGKAERAALRIQQDPVQAARQATTAIVDARRPMLLGASAQHLTEATPTDYTALSRAVRELKQSREQAIADVQRSVASLPPEEQQKAIQNFDNVINALASEMPKGLAMDKAINEQERRYTVFARSVLDPAYATQVIVNGGADGDTAAQAIKSLGPQGQEYLQNLADGLRDKINESEKLRGNEQLQQVYRNIKSKVSVSIGGGRARAGSMAALHNMGKAGLSPSPMVSAATQKNMAAAFSGTGRNP